MSFSTTSQLSSLVDEYNRLSQSFLTKTAMWKTVLPLAGTTLALLGTREYYKRKAERALREEQARKRNLANAATLLTAGAALGYFGPKLIKSKGLMGLKPDYDRIYGGSNYDPLYEQ